MSTTKRTLPNYYIKVGDRYFYYTDGAYSTTPDLPRGHRGARETLRSLEFAKLLGPATVVQVTLHEEPVNLEDLYREANKDIEKTLKGKLDAQELQYLRGRGIIL